MAAADSSLFCLSKLRRCDTHRRSYQVSFSCVGGIDLSSFSLSAHFSGANYLDSFRPAFGALRAFGREPTQTGHLCFPTAGDVTAALSEIPFPAAVIVTSAV